MACHLTIIASDNGLSPNYLVPRLYPDMPLQNLENQEISGKKPGDLTKNQEIVSNKILQSFSFQIVYLFHNF